MELSDELLCSDERDVWEEEGDKTRVMFRDEWADAPGWQECVVAPFVVELRSVSEATWSSSASLQDWEQYGPPSV